MPAGANNLSNTASIADDAANGVDPNTPNNSFTKTTTLNAAPDLAVTVADGGARWPRAGARLHPELQQHRRHPGRTGVVLTETLPANTTFNAAGSTAGWTLVSGSTYTLAVGGVAAGGTGTATFAVTVNAGTPNSVKSISNTASIADDGTNGPDLSNPNNTNTKLTALVASIAGRFTFYNNSFFDGGSTAINASDDTAIAQTAAATPKVALLPGQTATFANYTSYDKGINGLMVDIAHLQGTPTASDFTFKVGNDSVPAGWATLAATPTVTVRAAVRHGRADRVEITFPDGSVVGQWLQVTVKTGTATGLSANDVLYFGNAPAESGNSATDANVTSADELRPAPTRR